LHHARRVGEERADRLLDLVLDAVPELARGQEPPLHQHLAEASLALEAALGLAELIEVDDPRPEQALAQSIDTLVGGGEDHLALVEIHGLRVVAVGQAEEPRLLGVVNEMEEVGEREGTHVGREHEVPIPGHGGHRAGSAAAQQDGVGADVEDLERLVGSQAEAGPQGLVERQRAPVTGLALVRHGTSRGRTLSPRLLFDGGNGQLEGTWPRPCAAEKT
jgi:hypothetical protein